MRRKSSRKNPRKNPWYVIFGPRRVLGTQNASAAQTIRHFENEDAAREFARKQVDEGQMVEAGTKPGIEPAKKVRPAEIAAWCAEKD